MINQLERCWRLSIQSTLGFLGCWTHVLKNTGLSVTIRGNSWTGSLISCNWKNHNNGILFLSPQCMTVEEDNFLDNSMVHFSKLFPLFIQNTSFFLGYSNRQNMDIGLIQPMNTSFFI